MSGGSWSSLVRSLCVIGLISLIHCAYSAAQHRSYLRLTEQEFTHLPSDILLQTIVSLVVVCYSAAHVAGEFLPIRSDVQHYYVGAEKRVFPDVSFEPFQDSRIILGSHKVMGYGRQLSVFLHIRPSSEVAVTLLRGRSTTGVENINRTFSSLSTTIHSVSLCKSPTLLTSLVPPQQQNASVSVSPAVVKVQPSTRVISRLSSSHDCVPFSYCSRRFASTLSSPLYKSSQLAAVAAESILNSTTSSFSSRRLASSSPFAAAASNPPPPPPRQSPSSATPPAQDPLQYCIELVRKNDYENYLATLLLPSECHRYMFAIRAFNVELALVRNQIQRYSGTTGIYRLQFWKDTIDFLYGVKKGPVPRQPVAIALKKFAPTAEKELLYQLVESRQKTLGDRPFTNVDALEDYGRKTHGSLLRFAVAAVNQKRSSLSPEQAVVCEKVCDILGSALGLGTHLRATGPLLARGIVVLPADLMSIHGLSQEAVFSARDPPAFKKLSRDLGQLAEKRLTEAREMTSQVPREFRPVFLPAVGLDNFLTRLKKTDYNLLDAKLQRTFGLLSWQLGWRKLWGRY